MVHGRVAFGIVSADDAVDVAKVKPTIDRGSLLGSASAVDVANAKAIAEQPF